MAINRHTLRNQLRHKLLGVTPEERSHASQLVTRSVTDADIFIHSHNIACYIPIGNEINTDSIINSIWSLGKNCYLPSTQISTSRLEKTLWFIQYSQHDALVKVNNIFEPVPDKTKILPPEKLDLVIVPLVGFNKANFRLGRGAGYYDKTFTFRKTASKPYLLGISYNWQHVEFKEAPWDIAMNSVISA